MARRAHSYFVNTLADWNGLLPGEKAAVGDAEAEVAGLVIGPAGVYMLLTVNTPFPEGRTFQLDWSGKTMSGTVDYCAEKNGKYLMGIEIQRECEPAALAS